MRVHAMGMRAVRVKVCGITDPASGIAAAEAGADVLGFIMAPGSPRSLTVERARAIAREMPGYVDLVGVFVDAPVLEVVAVAAEVGLTAVQLHGSERWADYEAVAMPVVRAVRIASPADAVAVDWPPNGLLMADSHDPAVQGGSGRTFPWAWVADLGLRYRLIVSGGLSASNVGAAVRALKPWGVDASSRLESSPGVKDPAKVRAYIEAARRAEEEVCGVA
ncbi:MAG TPA: phosphoribosylanthranilate isomerase [Candidatus Dormibacteraeota bacterium]|jgi:phosphoribosylanthranilate isomerase|nr:phosphoribosylanthranilate isomerase [Candidatus Dormibacteraeota bacterium]